MVGVKSIKFKPEAKGSSSRENVGTDYEKALLIVWYNVF